MIRQETELSPLEKLVLQDFSYSRINTFKECQLRYFYSYIVKEPQDFGSPAKLGNIIHKALEVTLEDGEKINLRELLDNYNAAVELYDPQFNIPDNMITDGETMLQAFVDNHPNEVSLYAKELPFSFVLGRARFNGFIDFVEVSPTRVFIRDYKTGRQEISYKSVQENLQLGIYSLYLKSLYPDKEIYAEVYYLRSNKAKGHTFTDDDLLLIRNTLLELTETILTTENFSATSNDRACRFCSYAMDGVCPTGQLRLRRQNLLRD